MSWKGELIQQLTFLGLPATGAIGVWTALRLRALDGLGAGAFRRLSVALFVLTRLGVPLVVFGLFGYEGSGDLLRVWQPTAQAVLAGHDPAPHLDNLYGPLYPYVLASGWWISGRAFAPAIALPFVLADGLGLLLLLRMARRHLEERAARRAVLAALACPLLWLGGTVLTQDEPLFALLLLWTLDLADRGRPSAAVGAAALGALLTKALFPLFVLPVLLAAPDPFPRVAVRAAASYVLVGVGVAVALLLGTDLGTRFGAQLDVFGSSAWHLFVGPDGASPVAFRAGLIATGLACGALALVARRRAEGESTVDRAARGVVAVQAGFFVLCPFTIPLHMTHALPLLVWHAVREGATARTVRRGTLAVAAGLCAWQVPALWLGAERWKDAPPLVAAFVAFWAWIAWRAAACPYGRAGSDTAQAPAPPSS